MKKPETVVMKFGGTSVGSPDRIKSVASYVLQQAIDNNIRPVVVVSAMGHTTDQILRLFHETCPNAPHREIDLAISTGEQVAAALLAGTICAQGGDARALIAHQMRLTAGGDHRHGRIKAIQGAKQMIEDLKSGKILVCAGFQGITHEGEIVTLERGGSDTTAVALAHVLNASCDIFTDVKGVYAVDPRIVTNARLFPFINYRDMLTMSSAGAGVLADRAILLAQRLGIPLRVRLSPSLGETDDGTLVFFRHKNEGPIELDDVSSMIGLAIRNDVSVVTIRGIGNQPGRAAEIFESLEDVVIGDAIQGQGSRTASISLWIDRDDVDKVRTAIPRCKIQKNVACLTLVSPGMKEGTGYLARMTRALAKASVNIVMISTAGESILVMIEAKKVSKAAQAIAAEFHLCE